MDTVQIIVIILVGLGLLIWLSLPVKRQKNQLAAKVTYPSYHSAPQESEVTCEVVSFPKQLRRAQQSLNRKQNVIADKLHIMSHERNELSIGNLMLELGEKHLTIKDEAVQFKTEVSSFELLKKEEALNDRSRLIQIQEAKADLITDHIDIYKHRAENEIQDRVLDLKGNALKMIKKGNDLQLIAIENEKRAVKLDQENVKVLESQAMNKVRASLLSVQEEHHQVKKAELRNIIGNIKNLSDGLDLKDKEIAVNTKDALASLRHKEVDLRKLGLENVKDAIGNKLDQLKIQDQRIQLTYLTAKEGLKSMLNEIVNEQKKLKLMRREDALDHRKEELDLYSFRLRNWEKYIQEMYDIKMQKLQLESQVNDIDYQKQRMELSKEYNKTQNHIERLGLNRWENNLDFREKKLELNKLAGSIKRFWLN